jgi:hypothetical protein
MPGGTFYFEPRNDDQSLNNNVKQSSRHHSSDLSGNVYYVIIGLVNSLCNDAAEPPVPVVYKHRSFLSVFAGLQGVFDFVGFTQVLAGNCRLRSAPMSPLFWGSGY